MKFLILGLVLVGLFNLSVSLFTDVEYESAFNSWMQEHGKVYQHDEFHIRFSAFRSNMDYVHEWNSKNNMTILGLNKLADLTNEEYRALYLGTRVSVPEFFEEIPSVSAPLAATVDWRTKGVVTPIKDQGQCGSCWSFSTTGSIEGIHAMKTGNLVSLSEQQLVDCSGSYGNQGCNGGLMDSAFRYVIANRGLDTEASYPYTARDGSCKFNANNVAATITSYKDVMKSEAALQAAVATQPISVAIDAGHNSFQLYRSGVYYEAACSSTQLDHGVLAIGYGTDDASGADYWLVKNSWGTSWGQQGYIWMARNKNNNCGIATMASYPIA